MIVFCLCGLWHGAGWTFVVWGIWHGAFMVLEHTAFGRVVDRMWPPLRWTYALIVAMIGWVFFRSGTITYAASFVQAMFGFAHGDGLQYSVSMYVDRLTVVALVIAVAGSFPMSAVLARYKESVIQWSKTKSVTVQSAVAAGYALAGLFFFGGVLVLSAMAVASTTYKAFLYFQF
jgi:alginate O-acetyltransferase complex protein AlgI